MEARASAEDWYKAREYERQCALADAARRSWMTSYDPMLTAQRFGYTTAAPLAPTVSTQYGVTPKQKKAPKDEETEGFCDIDFKQLLNSRTGFLMFILLIVLIFVIDQQKTSIERLEKMVGVSPTATASIT